jgi:Acetyltransferase (GNAT) family
MPDPAVKVRLRIREIRRQDDLALGRAYRLLAKLFPASERMPRSAWLEVMQEREAGVWTDQNWHLFVAEYGRRIIGAASGAYLGNVNIGLVGYVAVTEGARAYGIGPRLRLALRLAFQRDALKLARRPLEAMVGEVHSENRWLRRLVRHGAIALDVPYFQPSLRPGGEDVPLVLYYQPVRVPRRSLPAAEVRRLLYAIWRRAYRVPKPLGHPAFRRMLRALEGRERIGQRTLQPPATQPTAHYGA